MTAVAESARSAHAPLVLDLIRPFTEHDDARLRGNAVIALTALIDGAGADLKASARDELVEVLCAEPSGRDLEGQRRITAISIDAIGQLKPEDSEAIHAKVLQNLDASRESAQRAAIARLLLAACDQGRRLWPANWVQFRRYATLAGQLTFWQCTWAAAWRSAVAFAALLMGAALREVITGGSISDDVWTQCFVLGLITVAPLAIILKLSIPGGLRPPSNVYLADTALNAIPFGLLALLGTLALAELSDEKPEVSASSMIVIFILGTATGATLRWLRWINARSAIEPDGASRLVRPATAFGLTAWACIILAFMGLTPETAATTFLVIVPASTVLASLDIWLEEKGPRTQLPLEPRNERRWLLPMFAAITVVLAAGFLTWNLRSVSAVKTSAHPGVTISQGTKQVAASIPMGEELPVQVREGGVYSIEALSDRSDVAAFPFVQDKDRNYFRVEYDNTVTLTKGEYTVCATSDSSFYRCEGVTLRTFIDHVVAAFGRYNASAHATLTFGFVRTPPVGK